MRFFGPRSVCSSPVATKTMTKSAMSAWEMKCLVPLRIQIVAVGAGGALHAAHVGPRPRLGHGQCIEAFAARRRQQVALPLLGVAGHEDAGGPAPEHGERHGRPPQFALQQGQAQMVQAAAAHLFGEVRGEEAELDHLALDGVAQFWGHFAAALDGLLVRIDLPLHEGPHGVHHQLLLGCQCEVQTTAPFTRPWLEYRSFVPAPTRSVRPRPSDGRIRRSSISTHSIELGEMP